MSRVALLLALLFAGAAVAQEPEVSAFGRRYDGFRQIFSEYQYQLGTAEQLAADLDAGAGGRWLVVALGDVRFAPGPAARAKLLLEQGGTLLAATDLDDEAFLPLGVAFRAGPVQADPRFCHRRNPWCPYLRVEIHPATAAGQRIAANRSGYLELAGAAKEIAALPPSQMPDGRVLGTPAALAALEFPGGGRALFAADHSLFVNEMFLDDRDRPLNAPFAHAAVQWLARERRPAEVRVLFLEEGVAASAWLDRRYLENDWRERTAKEAAEDFRKWLNMADRLASSLENRRDPRTGMGLFDLLAQQAQDGLPRGVGVRAALLAVLAALAFGTLGWWWRGLAKGKLPPAAPRSLAPLAELRRRAPADRGEHAPLARALAAAAFRKWHAPTPRPGAPPPAPPLDAVRFGDRRAARRIWLAAWRLASGAPGQPMSLRQYRRFHADLAWLDQRLAPNEAPKDLAS